MYFVAPTLTNIKRIAEDLQKGLYETFHLNFVEPLSRALLEELAASAARDGTGELIAQVGIHVSLPVYFSEHQTSRYWISISHSLPHLLHYSL